MQLQELVDGDPQVFSPARLAGVLRTTKAEIVGTLGLSRDALSRLASPGPEDADPAAGGRRVPTKLRLKWQREGRVRRRDAMRHWE